MEAGHLHYALAHTATAVELQVHLQVSELHGVGGRGVGVLLLGRRGDAGVEEVRRSKGRRGRRTNLVGEGEWLREVEERAGESSRALFGSVGLSTSSERSFFRRSRSFWQ